MITVVDSAGRRHEGLELELSMPLRGNWVAHVVTGEESTPPAGACTVEVERDGEPGVVDAFAGTLRYGSTWQGRTEFVVVGGAGGLAAQLPARHYAVKSGSIPAELVAADIAAAAGERLSLAAELDGLEVGQWTRAATTSAQALTLLADRFGLSWRVLADGTVWLGPETWPAAAPKDYAFQGDRDPDARAISVAPDRCTLRPGMLVLGEQIKRVTFTVGGGVRAKLLHGDTDRDEIASAVRAALPPPVYSQSFGATVVTQHPDDTLDVTVDDARLPELRRVAFRPGFVGARVLLATGTRVRVAFEGGSPAGAYAVAPDADPAAARGVARVGDTVAIGTLAVSMAGPVPQLTWTPVVGASVGPASSVTIIGAIASGSAEVLLR